MANDLLGFSRRMVLTSSRLGETTDQLVRKVALAADQTVVLATPVDTGRARSNWIAQIGSAPDQVVEAYAPGDSGSSGSQNASAALEQAAAVISGYTSGQTIHIANNLPYIQKLNSGSSAQAPAAFVEKAIQTAVDTLRAGRLLDG